MAAHVKHGKQMGGLNYNLAVLMDCVRPNLMACLAESQNADSSKWHVAQSQQWNPFACNKGLRLWGDESGVMFQGTQNNQCGLGCLSGSESKGMIGI